MRQKLIKVKNEDGSVHFERSRYLTLISIKPDQYGFKDQKGNRVEPTDLELELFNESQYGGIHITNGWLTFLGIIQLINLIVLLFAIGKVAS